MAESPANQLLSLVKNASIIDLSVMTGVNQPSSPPEGQRFGQFMMNHYTWPRGQFLEYVQVHDDHTGTHIDAPCHMIPSLDSGLDHATKFGNVTVEQLCLEDMVGEAVVVDVRALIDDFPTGEKTNLRESPVITRAFLEAWEKSCSFGPTGPTRIFGPIPTAFATIVRIRPPVPMRSNSYMKRASAISGSTRGASA
jgi:hypothetical protein